MSSADSDEKLFDIIKSGDAEAALSLLQVKPTSAMAVNEQGVSAVMWALYQRQEAVARAIAQHRVDQGHALTLHEAAALGRVADVAMRIQAGDDLTAFSTDGFTPLHFTAFFAREEAARRLLEAGAPVTVAANNPSRVHPLHSAAAANSLEICRLLLENGAEADAQQHGGYTALMSAALHGNVALVELLLEHSAGVEIRSDEGKTAADMADGAGHTAVVERLAPL